MSRLSLNCLLACVCLHLKYVYMWLKFATRSYFTINSVNDKEEDILMLQQQAKKKCERI